MVNYLSKVDYEQQTAKTRDQRMAWWREARFGMFIKQTAEYPHFYVET